MEKREAEQLIAEIRAHRRSIDKLTKVITNMNRLEEALAQRIKEETLEACQEELRKLKEFLDSAEKTRH